MPPSDQKFLFKRDDFFGNSGLIWPRTDKKLLQMFSNSPYRTYKLILKQKIKKKNIFDLKFPLFRPNFRGKSHFQRDETRDARESEGGE